MMNGVLDLQHNGRVYGWHVRCPRINPTHTYTYIYTYTHTKKKKKKNTKTKTKDKKKHLKQNTIKKQKISLVAGE